MEEVKLVGVSDLNEEAGEGLAAKYRTRYFRDYHTLLAEVDAVSVAVPTVSHYEIGRTVLQQGVHALIEKPMTTTLAEADELIALAGRRQLILQVGHLERFNPAVQALHAVVRDPKFFEIHRLGVFALRSLDIDVVLDLMIHDLDILLSLVKSEIASISSVGIPILSPKVDIANARIEFANGCVANVTASRVSSERIRKLRFFQPNSYISLDYEKQSLSVYSLIPTEGGLGKDIVSHNLVVEPHEPLRAEIESFIDCVGKGIPPRCTGDDGRKALALALRIAAPMKTA